MQKQGYKWVSHIPETSCMHGVTEILGKKRRRDGLQGCRGEQGTRSNNFWTSIQLWTVVLNVSYCVILSALDFFLLESPFFLWWTILCHSPSTRLRAHLRNHSNSKTGKRTLMRGTSLTNQFISPCQPQFGWGWTHDSSWTSGLILDILYAKLPTSESGVAGKVWLRIKPNNKAENWKRT